MLPDLPWKSLFPWSFPLILSLSYKLICQKCLGPQLRLREHHLWAEHPQPFPPAPGTATVNMALALAEVEGLQTWLLRPPPLGTVFLCTSRLFQELEGCLQSPQMLVTPFLWKSGQTLYSQLPRLRIKRSCMYMFYLFSGM